MKIPGDPEEICEALDGSIKKIGKGKFLCKFRKPTRICIQGKVDSEMPAEHGSDEIWKVKEGRKKLCLFLDREDIDKQLKIGKDLMADLRQRPEGSMNRIGRNSLIIDPGAVKEMKMEEKDDYIDLIFKSESKY